MFPDGLVSVVGHRTWDQIFPTARNMALLLYVHHEIAKIVKT